MKKFKWVGVMAIAAMTALSGCGESSGNGGEQAESPASGNDDQTTYHR
ncbi:hypothetical protein ACFFHM_04580 [Halalkalibacter kiskunsagensis]|uniref:Uncharacterized protein n=1 Tax=Halalkalibacter kiskunsagensis TaxID=1548599 RepID=A0ABV6K929_9BACI